MDSQTTITKLKNILLGSFSGPRSAGRTTLAVTVTTTNVRFIIGWKHHRFEISHGTLLASFYSCQFTVTQHAFLNHLVAQLPVVGCRKRTDKNKNAQFIRVSRWKTRNACPVGSRVHFHSWRVWQTHRWPRSSQSLPRPLPEEKLVIIDVPKQTNLYSCEQTIAKRS